MSPMKFGPRGTESLHRVAAWTGLQSLNGLRQEQHPVKLSLGVQKVAVIKQVVFHWGRNNNNQAPIMMALSTKPDREEYEPDTEDAFDSLLRSEQTIAAAVIGNEQYSSDGVVTTDSTIIPIPFPHFKVVGDDLSLVMVMGGGAGGTGTFSGGVDVYFTIDETNIMDWIKWAVRR